MATILVIGMIVGGITAAGTAAGAFNSINSSSSNVTIDGDSALGKLAAIGQQMEKQGKKMEAAQRSGAPRKAYPNRSTATQRKRAAVLFCFVRLRSCAAELEGAVCAAVT